MRAKLVGGPFDGGTIETGEREPEVITLTDNAISFNYVCGDDGGYKFFPSAHDSNDPLQGYTPEERIELMRDYCSHCGLPKPKLELIQLGIIMQIALDDIKDPRKMD